MNLQYFMKFNVVFLTRTYIPNTVLFKLDSITSDLYNGKFPGRILYMTNTHYTELC